MLLSSIFLLTFIFQLNCVVLRVRLPSGIMKRLDVEEDSLFADIKQRLYSLGYISTNSTVSFRSVDIDSISGKSLSQINAVAGEIITVLGRKNSSTETVNSNILNPQSKKVESKTKSLAEISKWRNNLIKIARQLPQADLSVRVSPACESAFHSLRNGKVGLLIGEYMSSSGKNKSIDVHGICLISKDFHSFLAIETDILKRVKLVAESLGLSILGVALGPANGVCREPKSSSATQSWTSAHLYACLSLTSILDIVNDPGASNQTLLVVR